MATPIAISTTPQMRPSTDAPILMIFTFVPASRAAMLVTTVNQLKHVSIPRPTPASEDISVRLLSGVN